MKIKKSFMDDRNNSNRCRRVRAYGLDSKGDGNCSSGQRCRWN